MTNWTALRAASKRGVKRVPSLALQATLAPLSLSVQTAGLQLPIGQL